MAGKCPQLSQQETDKSVYTPNIPAGSKSEREAEIYHIVLIGLRNNRMKQVSKHTLVPVNTTDSVECIQGRHNKLFTLIFYTVKMNL